MLGWLMGRHLTQPTRLSGWRSCNSLCSCILFNWVCSKLGGCVGGCKIKRMVITNCNFTLLSSTTQTHYSRVSLKTRFHARFIVLLSEPLTGGIDRRTGTPPPRAPFRFFFLSRTLSRCLICFSHLARSPISWIEKWHHEGHIHKIYLLKNSLFTSWNFCALCRIWCWILRLEYVGSSMMTAWSHDRPPREFLSSGARSNTSAGGMPSSSACNQGIIPHNLMAIGYIFGDVAEYCNDGAEVFVCLPVKL